MQVYQTEIREHSGLKYVNEETADEWIKSGTGTRGPHPTEGFEPI